MDFQNSVLNKSYISTDIRILYWNIRSVIPRIEELRKILISVDIFVCVESWLSDLTPDSKIQFPGFLILRKDRVHARGGGILFLIRKNIAFHEINNLININPSFELCGIRINNIKEPFKIIVCYKPPNYNATQDE